MSPRLFPAPPWGWQILIYEGLYEWTGNGWRCVRDCAVRRSTVEYLEWPREDVRAHYPEIGRSPQPFYWAGIWFLAHDGTWELARSWTNYGPDFV